MQLQVLILHFKRFLFGEEAAKLRGRVTHDSYTLNLLGVTYDLVGVLNHLGSNITSGHYNFDAICPTTGRAWRCSDDNDPWLLSAKQLCHDFETAYIHVWQKRPTPEEQQVGLQANVEEQRLRATSDEQQRGEELQANNEKGDGTPIGNCTGSISTSEEQQRRGGLQANDDARNGKLIGNCRGSIPSTVESCTEEDEGRRRFKGWVEEKESLSSITTTKRSKEEKNRIRWLQNQIRKVKTDYPDIETKKPPMTDAEKKAAKRNGQSEEEKEQVKANDRMRKEAERLGQSEEEKEQEKMEARQRMTAKRANVANKPRDGLNAQMTLAGSFRVDTNNLGAMDEVCGHCGARHFAKETGARMCCMNGRVALPCFKKPPPSLIKLLFKDDTDGLTFRKYIRSFNNALCLSSLQCNERKFRGNFRPTLVFEGRAHQFFGPLVEKEHETPKFAQVWVHDPALQTAQRINNMFLPSTITEVEKEAVQRIMETVQAELGEINPWIKDFRQIVEIQEEELGGGKLVISAKDRPAGAHPRTYNLAVSLAEVSVLTDCRPHDLVVTRRDGNLEVVSEQNSAALPLHFTLLVPHGDRGWHPEIRGADGKRLTSREFATYHMAIRDEILSYEEALSRTNVDYVYLMGRLWQEWLCIMWLITQNMRLNYQDMNQKALRADSYANVKRVVDSRRMELATLGDALYPDDHRLRTGVKVLSRSFVGSPRWYHMQFLDAMAICRKFGRPEYFVTMTCNPKWPEILAELRPGQSPEDRPEVRLQTLSAYVSSHINNVIIIR